jgi:SPX domain protein involved in polyphosphate accumulation
MKFSHSLQFNAVPDWSNHYIAYSNLKKQYVAYMRKDLGAIWERVLTGAASQYIQPRNADN